MGAEQFWTKSVGKTAKEAFNKARDHALYMRGHGGYTGSIAEKESYVIIDHDYENVDDIEAFADRLMDDADPRVDDKWGPAGCLRLRKLDDGTKEFLFFGWALS